MEVRSCLNSTRSSSHSASGGTLPQSKRLSSKCRTVSDRSKPISDGIEPRSWFDGRRNSSRAVKSPSSVGMVPSTWEAKIAIIVALVQRPSSVGIVPLSWGWK
eukprot:1186582-Prorocentrum_minimum.AAC.1